jgi:hypothetical protein
MPSTAPSTSSPRRRARTRASASSSAQGLSSTGDGGSREGDGDGYQWNGSFSYAHAINDSWSYRLNGGYLQSDPYSRPTGTIPSTVTRSEWFPSNVERRAVSGGVPIGGFHHPTEGNQLGQFQNEGTQQPKAGLRSTRTSRTGAA